MIFIPTRRVTLLIPSGPDHNPGQRHLFILLTDPHGANQEVLLTGISSVRAGIHHDQSCILYPGDHAFIRQESYVNYRNARIERADALTRGVRQGVLIPKETIDGGIFARVCQGLLESRHTAEKLKQFYRTATGE